MRTTDTLRRLSLLLAVAWAALIWYLSAQSSLPIPSLFPQQDKLLHISAYGVLAFLVTGARKLPLQSSPAGFLWKSVVLCGLYGLSDEIHQSFVPGRDPDVFDLCADVTGAVLGATAMYLLLRYCLRRATA